jgi:hypothetical protein
VRILIADDKGDAPVTLAMPLKIGGHTVRVAHDSMDAVEARRMFTP